MELTSHRQEKKVRERVAALHASADETEDGEAGAADETALIRELADADTRAVWLALSDEGSAVSGFATHPEEARSRGEALKQQADDQLKKLEGFSEWGRNAGARLTELVYPYRR